MFKAPEKAWLWEHLIKQLSKVIVTFLEGFTRVTYTAGCEVFNWKRCRREGIGVSVEVGGSGVVVQQQGVVMV